jgi:acyl-CoA reductase-like NAD-dependent aldehyde dehydrogenase
MPELDTRQTLIERLLHKAYREPSPAEVLGAMDKAREATGLWRQTPVGYRVRYLAALRRAVVDNLDQIVQHIARVTGAVPAEALISDIYPALESLAYCERHAASLLAPQRVKTPLLFQNAVSIVEHDPFGVVLVVAPRNFSFNLALAPLTAALAAGNGVILKPSEAVSPIGELVDTLCRRAHLPQDLVQVLYGGPATVRRLIDARPDMIFFAGSTAAGRAVMAQAAGTLIPLVLELGGKDPMIVFGDAAFERAVNGAVYGAFAGSGQACVAVKRLYVQDTLYERFVTALVRRTNELRFDTDIGPLAGRDQLDAVEAHVYDALKKGATALTPIRRRGRYYAPVILRDVDRSMKVMREETFGPVLPVMAFRTEDEAVRLANDTPYGLSASVWTRDLDRGRRIAARLHVGSCAVNDVRKQAGSPHLPFGGIRQSGFGRYHGPEGLYAFSTTRSVLVNVGETEQELNWFPYSQNLYDTLKYFLNLFFSDRLLRLRLRGLWKALRFVQTRERLW